MKGIRGGTVYTTDSTGLWIEDETGRKRTDSVGFEHQRKGEPCDDCKHIFQLKTERNPNTPFKGSNSWMCSATCL